VSLSASFQTNWGVDWLTEYEVNFGNEVIAMFHEANCAAANRLNAHIPPKSSVAVEA